MFYWSNNCGCSQSSFIGSLAGHGTWGWVDGLGFEHSGRAGFILALHILDRSEFQGPFGMDVLDRTKCPPSRQRIVIISFSDGIGRMFSQYGRIFSLVSNSLNYSEIEVVMDGATTLSQITVLSLSSSNFKSQNGDMNKIGC